MVHLWLINAITRCYKSVINLYSNVACSVLGIGNQQELSTNLESDPFLNTAMQRFTCNLYYRFGTLLAPVSIGIITGNPYQNSVYLKYNVFFDEVYCNHTEKVYFKYTISILGVYFNPCGQIPWSIL